MVQSDGRHVIVGHLFVGKLVNSIVPEGSTRQLGARKQGISSFSVTCDLRGIEPQRRMSFRDEGRKARTSEEWVNFRRQKLPRSVEWKLGKI